VLHQEADYTKRRKYEYCCSAPEKAPEMGRSIDVDITASKYLSTL